MLQACGDESREEGCAEDGARQQRAALWHSRIDDLNRLSWRARHHHTASLRASRTAATGARVITIALA